MAETTKFGPHTWDPLTDRCVNCGKPFTIADESFTDEERTVVALIREAHNEERPLRRSICLTGSHSSWSEDHQSSEEGPAMSASTRPAADWLDRSDLEAGRLAAINARNQSRPIQANADRFEEEGGAA